jgi:hypothetical protein
VITAKSRTSMGRCSAVAQAVEHELDLLGPCIPISFPGGGALRCARHRQRFPLDAIEDIRCLTDIPQSVYCLLPLNPYVQRARGNDSESASFC